MSEFLGFESFLIPLGASITEVKNTIRDALVAKGWQVQYEGIPYTAALGNWGTVANGFTDEGPGTNCTTTAAFPVWVGIQSSVAFTPTKVHITGSGVITESPKTFTIDWSDNGSSWTVHQTVSNETNWGYCETRTFEITGAPSKSYWRISCSAVQSGTTKTISKVFFQNATGQRITDTNEIYIIPPSDQTIGCAKTRSLLHIFFTASSIYFRPVQELLQTQKQAVTVYSNNPLNVHGAVAMSITVNGSTVTGATGTASSTVRDNLRSLYEAICNSSDPNITAFKWEYDYATAQNSTAVDHIFGFRQDTGANYVISGSNLNGGTCQSGNRQVPMIQPSRVNAAVGYGVTTDLVNGFIYYLQICKRGIALATKTNAGFYGPIHASYVLNSQAVAALPVDSEFCTPIDLLIGDDEANTSVSSYAVSDHIWNITANTQRTTNNPAYWGYDSYGPPLFGGFKPVRRLHDAKSGQSGSYQKCYAGTKIALRGSSLGSGADSILNDFQIHRMSTGSYLYESGYSFLNTQNLAETSVAPAFEAQDWYKFVGTATNESLLLVADTITTTTLNQTLDSTTSYTTIDLTSATSFPSSGFVIIENEAFQYTGKSGNTLTGVTRARYATTATFHATGTKVCVGLWFTIINGGALLCGYNKPS